MNDRHPSGTMTTPVPASDAASAHYDASYDGQDARYDGGFTPYGGYDTGTFATGAPAAAFESDPLFGGIPDAGQATGVYDTTHWQPDTAQSGYYDAYAAQHQPVYDTGGYDTTAWNLPQQATAPDVSGQWETSAWLQPGQSGTVDPSQQWDWGTQTFDTGAYDATAWHTGGSVPAEESGPHGQEEFDQRATAAFEQQSTAVFEQHAYDEDPSQHPYDEAGFEQHPYDEATFGEPDASADEHVSTGEMPTVGLLDDQEEFTPSPSARNAGRSGGRSRRRQPARRSALLTVAVPSACVMGVAGIAAASVGGLTDDGKETSAAASDGQAVKPSAANNKLDTQLESLSAGAHDFTERASRTQERIDLKAQQAAEKKKAAAEAALKERLRPKFVLPVTQKGLSAYFGQAGVNWMSVHTGIDFPVSYGTTVMAATDGTVRTQWNSAYGNMAIVTAKDGTETWYCHLSSYRVPSGTTVKAGQPIAYSGNSGNSTGPHMHFEVRPAGGAAIDPLLCLPSHGLDPT